MNFKKTFYKEYYEGIDFRKFDKEEKRNSRSIKTLAEDIEAANAKKYKDRNENIFDESFNKVNFKNLDLSELGITNYIRFPLCTTYPGLLTGIGMVHETNNQGELKLGFFFDHTSGLPMLPGSSVKGAIRGAFPNFSAQKEEPLLPDIAEKTDKKQNAYLQKQKAKARFIASLLENWKTLTEKEQYNKVHQLELALFEGVDIQRKQEKPKEDGQLPISQRCRFLDAIIVQSGNAHNKILGIDALTPHGTNPLKNPIPLPFLKVLPKVVFQFQFILPKVIINKEELGGEKLKQLFKNILMFMGMGAKTNVGYGQFTDEIPQSKSGVDKPRVTVDNWEEVIPDKAIPQLKKEALIDGEIVRIEGDNVYVHFILAGETGETRKKYRSIKIGKEKVKAMEQVAIGMKVIIKVQKDYEKFAGNLQCQIKLNQ